MKISKNSWHYKFYNFSNTSIPKDLCMYIKGLVKSSFFVGLAILAVIFPWISSFLWGVPNLEEDKEFLYFILWVIGFVVNIFLITIIFIFLYKSFNIAKKILFIFFGVLLPLFLFLQ